MENAGTIFLTPPLVVKAQELDNFNCTFLVVLEMTLFATAQFKMTHSSGGMATVAFAALPFYTTAIQPEMTTIWLQK